jgi:hypothetical protein
MSTGGRLILMLPLVLGMQLAAADKTAAKAQDKAALADSVNKEDDAATAAEPARAPGTSPSSDSAPARAAAARRFLDGFWVRMPNEEPSTAALAPSEAEASARAAETLSAAAALPLRLHTAPSWQRWLLPLWSWRLALALCFAGLFCAFAGIMRALCLALRDPRRLRRVAALKELRAWQQGRLPPPAELLQAFRDFYELPAGSDAFRIAALIGQRDTALAQALLLMEQQRFALAPERLAGQQRFAPKQLAEQLRNATPATGCLEEQPAEQFDDAEPGVACPGPALAPLLPAWLRRASSALPGRGSAFLALLLAVLMTLMLALLLHVSVASFDRWDRLAAAWQEALQANAEADYPRAYAAFRAIAQQAPSSPALSRNLAALAAANGLEETARAWQSHASLQEKQRESIRLGARDWRCPLALAAWLCLLSLLAATMAAAGWPECRRWLRKHCTWLALPAAVSLLCLLPLAAHWQQCRDLRQHAVLISSQPLSMLPQDSSTVNDANLVLCTLAAGDKILLLQQHGDFSFVATGDQRGWLPRKQLLPLRL